MDKEKIIRGLERCLVCNTSAITSAEGEKAYRDCEYTVGLYCRQDKLLRDVLSLLKEQKPETGCWVHGHCSCCGEDIGSKLDTWTNIQQFLFCPNCGAKMEGR